MGFFDSILDDKNASAVAEPVYAPATPKVAATKKVDDRDILVLDATSEAATSSSQVADFLASPTLETKMEPAIVADEITFDTATEETTQSSPVTEVAEVSFDLPSEVTAVESAEIATEETVEAHSEIELLDEVTMDEIQTEEIITEEAPVDALVMMTPEITPEAPEVESISFLEMEPKTEVVPQETAEIKTEVISVLDPKTAIERTIQEIEAGIASKVSERDGVLATKQKHLAEAAEAKRLAADADKLAKSIDADADEARKMADELRKIISVKK